MTLRKKKPKRDSGTRSRTKKGPARDAKHLAKVRAYGCIGKGYSFQGGVQWEVIEAHHVRCIGPRTMGKRVSDYLAVPLCRSCHAELHRGKEEEFWRLNEIDPAAWIRSFSEEGRKALMELEATHEG